MCDKSGLVWGAAGCSKQSNIKNIRADGNVIRATVILVEYN